MTDLKLALNIARELLDKRRRALECAKNFEQALRDISKTHNLNIDLVNDTVTEEVIKKDE